MDFFKDFVASDAFFPVLIGLMLALVLVFVWILLGGKKKLEKKTSDTIVETATVVNNDSPIVNAVEQPMEFELPEIKEEVKPLADVVVDLPINTMDETPVEVSITKDELNDIGETVEIEHTTPLVEENISDDEIVDISLPGKKEEEQGETVELPETKEVVDDQEGTPVELPISKTLINDVGEEAVAFDTIPEANRVINEEIKVEQTTEYTGEKTEIFDFPDFSTVDQNDENKLTGNVENDVIKAADNYISNVIKES